MKYKYIVTPNKVIAISHYAGKPVRGIAKCDPRDTFDEEKGKELAKCRCDMKIAEKRKKRAEEKYAEAELAKEAALQHLRDMQLYRYDAKYTYTLAIRRLKDITDECAKKN